MHFSELNLPPEILKAIDEVGYTEPTPIQAQSIPPLLEKKDVIGRSHTGTGKTAAFGIPSLTSISRENNGVEVLILCPTRELAVQASVEIKRFAKYMPWVKPSAVYGGAPMDKQIFELKRGANIVIGTPGRVMDHIDRRTLKLGNLKTIILDEADEMLNMGFREDIETILKGVPDERQTVLFSATMPPAIMALTKNYQKDPVIVKIESAQRTVESVDQYFYEVPIGRKLDALVLLLTMYEPKLSMIFCNTKKMVDELTEALSVKGFKAVGLHGDMKQSARNQVMERFKSGRAKILIATDVAARGIDVDNVDAVFNFDIPQDNEYYIHRIGRTGRAGKTGTAFTLTSGRKQAYEMRDIQRFVKTDISQKALPSADEICAKRFEKFTSRLEKYIDEKRYTDFEELASKILSEGVGKFEEVDAKTVCAALLSMTLSKEIKNIPTVEAVNLPRDNNRNRKGTSRIHLSVGRKDKVTPNFILGSLIESSGLNKSSFGKIDIRDIHTVVEVTAEDKENVINAINGTVINGRTVKARTFETKARNFDNKNNNRYDRNDKSRFNKPKRRYDKRG